MQVDATSLRESPFVVDSRLLDRLAARVAKARRRAGKRGRPVLAGVTLNIPVDSDPSAVVCASRRPGEHWFALEQPDRGRFALAALGCATTLEAGGPRRFEELAGSWRVLASDAVCDPPDGPHGSGPVAVGGFAFAPQGAARAHWRGFAPASLIVPEVALCRGPAAHATLTLTALVGADAQPEAVVARLVRRLEGLRCAPLPLLDPFPARRAEVTSAMAPEHFEAAVERAVERIAGGELRKIVLAREVLVRAPGGHDPAAVLGVLRDAFPACHVFCIGRGEAAFVGATPELLLRREGLRVGTLALAGSTRRSADPAVDDHLGEQLLRSAKDVEEHAIVARRIERALRPHAVWVTAAREPALVRVANIQHLATPIRAQLAVPIDAIELAGLLHPTPAVGGEPAGRAIPLIPALEGFDRGWYAGPLGWTDVNGDGELCVALRCALLEGVNARCFAGVGVVAGSRPQEELAETEIKLGALLPVLAG